MKMRIIVLSSLLLAPLSQAQTNTTSAPATNSGTLSVWLAHLDEQYGFRDMKLDQPVDSFKGLTLIEDDPVIKFYDRKGESLEYKGTKLKSVEYGFYKGKLATIVVTTEADPNGVSLLKTLEEEFGPATKAPHNPKKVYWFGTKVTADYLINDKGVASVIFWSKAQQAQRGADAKAAKH